MKSTQEIQHIKEELEKKELIKEAAAKRQEKLNDIAAKKRIQEKIAADKEERRLKAERIKAEREGRTLPADLGTATSPTAPVTSKPATTHAETRLRLQTAAGNVQKTFPVNTTLFEVAQTLEAENGGSVESFTTTYPKKVFSGSLDFAKTLMEAGLVPSAVLIVK
jgi:UBX domain-containing protein 1/4